MATMIALTLVGGFVAVAAEEGERGPAQRAVAEGGRETGLAPTKARARMTASAPSTTVAGMSSAPPAAPTRAALTTFNGCSAVLTHLKTEGLARVTAWGLPETGHSMSAVGMPAGAGAATSGDAGGGPGYSTTNVQEQGVDEPDVVKGDAERVVTLFDGRLRVLSRDGDRLNVEGTLPLGVEGELLVVDDHAVVIGAMPGETRLVTVDLDDLAIVADRRLDGTYVSARSARGSVRVVVAGFGADLPFTQPTSEHHVADALAHNRSVVASSSIEQWLPAPDRCEHVYAPTTFSGFGTTVVATVDPATGEVIDATSVLASATEVYATVDHLYVAALAWEADLTTIHRFDLGDPRRAAYEASGGVAGHLLRPFAWGGGHLGQWSLSEHDGDLRVATTSLDAAVSTVTVLRRHGAVLAPVGAVTGLGPTEQIYAVRFMGPLGYVVTYRRTDPLYVLDLADPRAPRVLGELKVTGYSAYLHPIGPGLLLGIGQDDPDEDGQVDGTQVALFDVSDPRSPRRTAHLKLGDRGTVSLAEHDHRAFTWWDEPARAVLPLDSFSEGHRFRGAVSLDVTATSITEVGRVAHAPDGCRHPVVRSRVIDGVVYTFSGAGVHANELGDFDRLGSTWYEDVPDCFDGDEPTPRETTTTTTTAPSLVP